MATTISRKKLISPPPQANTARRRGYLWGFDYRHPLEALWRLFRSLRLMIVIISLLLAVSLIGVIIAQAPAEVVSSPDDFNAWVAVTAHNQYNNFTDLLNWLQFFTIFRSWYFKVLVVLLALNILVGGMLARWPSKWQNFRHPLLKRADGFYSNSPVKAGVTAPFGPATSDTVAGLRQLFRRRGYRVRAAPASDGDVEYLYIYQGAWPSLSTFIFHTCLILTMLCAVVTSWGGFGRDSMAQRILPGPVYHYFQDLAGFSYTQPLANGDGGIVYPYGTDHNIRYTSQDFGMVVDEQRGQPTDFYTDLQVYQDGKLVASQRIRVNDALTYQGVTFHQASFMMYTQIQLRDAQGNVIYAGSIPLVSPNTAPDPNKNQDLPTNTAEDVLIPTYNDTLNLVAAAIDTNHWYLGVGGFDGQSQPLFKIGTLITPNSPQKLVGCVTADPNAIPTDPDQYGCKLSNGWWLQVNDLRRGTVLLITKDAGSPLLWPTLAFLVLSLTITFLFPFRRIWVRVAGDQVQMASLAEHFVNMQREIDSVALKLGNEPLRPPPSDDVPPPKASAKKRPKVAAGV